MTYEKEELSFGYRESRIAEPLILSATFNLQDCDPIKLRERVIEIFAWKASKQPLADASAGCVFKNPTTQDGGRISAGKIIDDAGVKGLSVGGASVSMQHANFITTTKEATGNDVITLIRKIKDRIKEHSGINLQEELVIWSRDPEIQR